MSLPIFSSHFTTCIAEAFAPKDIVSNDGIIIINSPKHYFRYGLEMGITWYFGHTSKPSLRANNLAVSITSAFDI